MPAEIFTIGHSSRPLDGFRRLLQQASVDAIADVRSIPFSKSNPQFNRPNLREFLLKGGIRYSFLGEYLGARSDDESCYKHNRVQYDLLALSADFKAGLDKLLADVRQGSRLAILCAERDPLYCHRGILISRVLESLGIAVTHIIDNGQVERHQDSLKRLIDLLGIQANMFKSFEDLCSDAYAIQGSKIAFVKEAANG